MPNEVQLTWGQTVTFVSKGDQLLEKIPDGAGLDYWVELMTQAKEKEIRIFRVTTPAHAKDTGTIAQL